MYSSKNVFWRIYQPNRLPDSDIRFFKFNTHSLKKKLAEIRHIARNFFQRVIYANLTNINEYKVFKKNVFKYTKKNIKRPDFINPTDGRMDPMISLDTYLAYKNTFFMIFLVFFTFFRSLGLDVILNLRLPPII